MENIEFEYTEVEGAKPVLQEKTELLYLETPSGMHIGVDATYLEQVGDLEITIKETGETIKIKSIE